MLLVPSSMHGYVLEANDGSIGTVKDFLFDDRSWQCRWIVLDTGGWLTDRKVLIHPSALGVVDHDFRSIPVDLTRAQVAASPRLTVHEPVSMQVETGLYDYYGWDPLWGDDVYGVTGLGMLNGPERYFGQRNQPREPSDTQHRNGQSENLRSMEEITGYHVEAEDGAIGHVENMLIDDAGLGVRYLIIDTSNWWFGHHVLMSPFAIREIEAEQRKVFLDVIRQKVKDSPPFDPIALINADGQKRLHRHYGWMGYGW